MNTPTILNDAGMAGVEKSTVDSQSGTREKYYWHLTCGLWVARYIGAASTPTMEGDAPLRTPYAVHYRVYTEGGDHKLRYEGVALSYGMDYYGLRAIRTDLVTEKQTEICRATLGCLDTAVLLDAAVYALDMQR